MKLQQFVNKLRKEASKSELNHKHACMAISKGKAVTPTFHNYMRTYIYIFKFGSAHAEMATINYLLNSLWSERQCEKRLCIL